MTFLLVPLQVCLSKKLYIGGGPSVETIDVTIQQGELGAQACLNLEFFVGGGPSVETIDLTNKQGELGAFMDVYLDVLFSRARSSLSVSDPPAKVLMDQSAGRAHVGNV